MMNFKPKTFKIREGSWTIFLELCKGCGICLEKCPMKALFFGQEKGFTGKSAPEVNEKKCNLCGICEISCPDCAIRVNKK